MWEQSLYYIAWFIVLDTCLTSLSTVPGPVALIEASPVSKAPDTGPAGAKSCARVDITRGERFNGFHNVRLKLESAFLQSTACCIAAAWPGARLAA